MNLVGLLFESPRVSSTIVWKRNPKLSFDKVCVCMGGTDDKRLGGRQEKMRARWKFQEAFFFFLTGFRKWGYKGKTQRSLGNWQNKDERLHPWVGQSTEKWSRKWGKGEKFAFSLITLNNNPRLNPQEFGLSPRKGMNLIIFDPFSNKRAFKLWLLSLRVKDLWKEFVYSAVSKASNVCLTVSKAI